MSRLVNIGVLALILAASAALYFYRLDAAPPHIQIDEAMIAVNAHAIATTGRDLRGEFLPLYTRTADTSWYQPMVIYASAAALAVLPFNEWTVRTPTVLFALANIALMFVFIRRLFGSVPLAAIAAAMLALTPGHIIHARYGVDYLFPVTFILGWLVCLVTYRERRQPWLLALASMVLGIGFYCYISSIVMMPLYLVLTLLMLYDDRAPQRSFALTTGLFFALQAPFLFWLSFHPEAYTATVAKYGLYDTTQLNAAQGLRSTFSFLSISQRLDQYWNYFDPSFLFFGSGIKVQFSTNLVGVFLLPMAFFIGVGVFAAAKHRAAPLHRVVLWGFVSAPLAAAIPTEQNAIFRALGLLPFGVILAAIGIRHLWRHPLSNPLAIGLHLAGWVALGGGVAYGAWTLATQHRLTSSTAPLVATGVGALVLARYTSRHTQLKAITVALFAVLLLQFNSFWSDYLNDYRVRSAFWIGGNLRGAMEELIARSDGEAAPDIYFSTLASTGGHLDWRNDFIDTYWRFYLVKHDRLDLAKRTHHLGTAAIDSVPLGSLILANLDNSAATALAASGVLTRVTTIDELDGRGYFVIYQR